MKFLRDTDARHKDAVALADIKIYTDGGCDPNPGTGGYGAIVVCGNQNQEVSGGFQNTTNNRMEIFAAIAGLETLMTPSRVTLISDSRYLVDAMKLEWAKRWRANGWWRTKRERAVNADLWARLLTLCERHQVAFEWVKGHAGHEQNERCDVLAMLALKQPNLPVDTGYTPHAQDAETVNALTLESPAGHTCLNTAIQSEPCRTAEKTAPLQLEFDL